LAARLVEGYLLHRSGNFPRFIGVLMAILGLCRLICCFADLLAPLFADLITPATWPNGMNERASRPQSRRLDDPA
jgi:Domain of unknown function (DUF4386)